MRIKRYINFIVQPVSHDSYFDIIKLTTSSVDREKREYVMRCHKEELIENLDKLRKQLDEL